MIVPVFVSGFFISAVVLKITVRKIQKGVHDAIFHGTEEETSEKPPILSIWSLRMAVTHVLWDEINSPQAKVLLSSILF